MRGSRKKQMHIRMLEAENLKAVRFQIFFDLYCIKYCNCFTPFNKIQKIHAPNTETLWGIYGEVQSGFGKKCPSCPSTDSSSKRTNTHTHTHTRATVYHTGVSECSRKFMLQCSFSFGTLGQFSTELKLIRGKKKGEKKQSRLIPFYSMASKRNVIKASESPMLSYLLHHQHDTLCNSASLQRQRRLLAVTVGWAKEAEKDRSWGEEKRKMREACDGLPLMERQGHGAAFDE